MKKVLALVLISVLGLTLLCGCEGGKTTETEPTEAVTTVPVTEVQADYEDVYAEVLDRYYGIITDEEDVMLMGEGNEGIYDAVAELDKEAALDAVGYTFKDLTGDGFAELLVGAVVSNATASVTENDLFAVYTIAHDMPWILIEGNAAKSYRLLEDGTFLMEDLSDAAYRAVGNFRVSQGGTALICQDYYFTQPSEADSSVTEIYHNTSGKNNPEMSEKLDITSDDFSKIRTDYEEKIVSLDLTSFAQYN